MNMEAHFVIAVNHTGIRRLACRVFRALSRTFKYGQLLAVKQRRSFYVYSPARGNWRITVLDGKASATLF